MKHLKLFTPFINEQDSNKNVVAGQDTTGTSKEVAASLSGIGDLFKKYGFGDWVGGDTEGGGTTWGERLQGSGAWSATDHRQLKQWFKDFLTWMTTSEIGLDEADEHNNHGTYYDVQV